MEKPCDEHQRIKAQQQVRSHEVLKAPLFPGGWGAMILLLHACTTPLSSKQKGQRKAKNVQRRTCVDVKSKRKQNVRNYFETESCRLKNRLSKTFCIPAVREKNLNAAYSIFKNQVRNKLSKR